MRQSPSTALLLSWLLLLAAPLPGRAETWVRDWSFDASEIPVEFTADVAAPGLVWVETLSAAPDFVLDLLADDLPQNRQRAQFRVPAGAFRLRVNPRPNLLVKGPIALRVHYAEGSDPTEPANDAPSTARPVNFDQPVSLTLFPAGEADFLSVDAPGPGYLFIDAPGAPESFALHAEITAANGAELGINSAQVNEPGPLLIRVSDQWNAFASTSPLQLHLRFIDELDPSEPNQSPETAAAIGIGSWHRTYLLPSGDADFFRVEVPGDGRLRVESPDAPFDLQWSRVDPDDSRLVTTGPELNVRQGLTYLRLSAGDPTHSSLEPFHFQVLWLPGTPANPDAVRSAGRRYSIHLPPGGRSTWELDVPVPSVVWFHAESREEGAAGGFSTERRSSVANPIWLRGGPGTVGADLLREDKGRLPAPFQVWMDVEPEPDPTEPNDRIANSRPLSVNRPLAFALYPREDMDWFSFRLHRQGTLQLEVHSATAELDAFPHGIELGITDREAAPLAQRIGSSGDGIVWRPAPFDLSRGEYRVWLRGRRGGSSRSRLTLVARPIQDDSPLPTPEVDVLVLDPPVDPAEANALRAAVASHGGTWKEATASSTTAALDPAAQPPAPTPGPAETPAANAPAAPRTKDAGPSPAAPGGKEAASSVPEPPRRSGGLARWWWLLIPAALAVFFFLRVSRPRGPRRIIDLTG